MQQSWVVLIFVVAAMKCWAQQPDSTGTTTATPLLDSILTVDSTKVIDSVEVKKGLFSFFTKDYPNPKKAAYLSLALPGAGQMYNKRWWKVPLVYGAIGGMVALIDYNQSWYKRSRTAYTQSLKGETIEDEQLRNLSTNSLRLVRDQFDKNTQLSYIGLVVVYALQSVEAFVDAHLKTFDVNEDLSLQLKPSLQTNLLTSQPAFGIGVAIQFE